MTFADSLTILRLLIVPFFLAVFLMGEFRIAFILFTIAGVTDLIDGSIARWLKNPSKLGAFLDPIADKALMMTTVSCLLVAQIIPVWFFAIVIFRDVSILAGLALLRYKKISFELKPLMTSKFGTLSNIILVVFGFLSFLEPTYLFLGKSFDFWFKIFLGCSTALVIVSGCQYGVIGGKILYRRLNHGQRAL